MQEIAKALGTLPWGIGESRLNYQKKKKTTFLAAPSIRVLETLSQDPGQKLS